MKLVPATEQALAKRGARSGLVPEPEQPERQRPNVCSRPEPTVVAECGSAFKSPRDIERRGTIEHWTTTVLGVHGLDRHGRPLQLQPEPAWWNAMRPRPERKRTIKHTIKRSIMPVSPTPLDLSAPRPKLPDTIGKSRIVTRNLNVVD